MTASVSGVKIVSASAVLDYLKLTIESGPNQGEWILTQQQSQDSPEKFDRKTLRVSYTESWKGLLTADLSSDVRDQLKPYWGTLASPTWMSVEEDDLVASRTLVVSLRGNAYVFTSLDGTKTLGLSYDELVALLP